MYKKIIFFYYLNIFLSVYEYYTEGFGWFNSPATYGHVFIDVLTIGTKVKEVAYYR